MLHVCVETIIETTTVNYFSSSYKSVFQIFYRDICSDSKYVENTRMDSTAKTAYTFSNPTWISYDNKASFLNKVCYFTTFVRL